MQLDVQPGRYVVAVSGGVDSMVLLDVLASTPGLELSVAHFDHGIRPDSGDDRLFVGAAAHHYGLPFEYAEGQLGPQTSEDVARRARYAFLDRVCQARGAKLITAHHKDDQLETAIINMMRGTGPRGLAGLRSTPDILRPLLAVSKADLLAYARRHNIEWREDSTNADPRYLRNYIRLHLLPRFDASQKETLLRHIQKAGQLQLEIDAILADLRREQPPHSAHRQWFIMLPHRVACEYLADWLRTEHVPFDRRTVERLVVFAKTASGGKQADIQAGYKLEISGNLIRLLSQSDS